MGEIDLVDLGERLVKKALSNGASEAEIYIAEGEHHSIECIKEDVDRISYLRRMSIGVRVVVGKRIAVQGATISSIDEGEKLVLSAIKIAKTSPEDPHWKTLPRKLAKRAVSDIYDDTIDRVDLGELAKDMKSTLSEVKALDKRLSPIGMDITLTKGTRIIVNSYSSTLIDKSTLVTFAVGIKARDAGSESSYYDFVSRRYLSDVNIDDVTRDTAYKALMFLKAKKPPTGRYEVLFTNKVFATFLSAIMVPAISAYWVQMGRSPLAGKLNEQVLSSEFTIIDDGTVPKYVATRSYDDEGVETSRKIVFNKGILLTYLYDTYTALKENRESTGNAVRRSLSSMPIPWITNLIVTPGDAEFSEMTREIKKGIVVYATIGEWLSNPVSGLLNATISNGLYVENGEVKYAVKGAVINADFYEVLRNKVVAIGKDVDNAFNVYSPSILVRDIQVSGK